MLIFDTHFHYDAETESIADYRHRIDGGLNEAAQDLALASPARFGGVVQSGSVADSAASVALAEAVPSVYAAVGIHPHEADAFVASQEEFPDYRGNPRVAAVGEIGLDYFYEISGAECQKRVFGQFLRLALEWQRPAVIHLRDQEDRDQAYRDGYGLLREFALAGGRFVVHCFAGTPQWAEKFLELGAYLGVTGMVTFRRSDNIREIARMVPPERLLIETDAPYLAPVPKRGNPNNPGWILYTARYLSEMFGEDLANFTARANRNASAFYNRPVMQDNILFA